MLGGNISGGAMIDGATQGGTLRWMVLRQVGQCVDDNISGGAGLSISEIN